jgi:hypothetical protein
MSAASGGCHDRPARDGQGPGQKNKQVKRLNPAGIPIWLHDRGMRVIHWHDNKLIHD